MESGQTLTHYVIAEKIGAGGMGEVWRARDTRLERDVAIKVLPPAFMDDEERLRRFEREAKVLAALNDPHIAQIFGVDQKDDLCFLVLELVPGETLAERLEAGPLPVEEALGIARQMAEGLEVAHDAGIIHRDLKPANVRITPDGVVKILDFGLAKAAGKDTETVESLPLDSDSLTLTADGRVLGTPTYMSPEQARAKRTDRRTDIWAFGCVLFEMLSGQRAFSGETLTDVLGAIVHKDPEWDLLPPRVPARVRTLLRRCLSKDARSRLRDIGDARVELEEILADPNATAAIDPLVGEGAPAARPTSKVLLALLVVVAAAAVAVATWAMMGRSEPPEPRVRRFRIEPPEIDGGRNHPVLVAPDGESILYSAGSHLWVRELDSLDPRRIGGTEDAEFAFWSPDSRQVGFTAEGKLWRVPVEGGSRTVIANMPRDIDQVGNAVWLDDDTIVWTTAVDNDPIRQVSARGGEPKVLFTPDSETVKDFHQIAALPDGRGIIVVVHGLGLGHTDIAVLPAGGSELHVLFGIESSDDLWTPQYSPSGHVVFHRRGTDHRGIWALPFSLDDLRATGDPFLVSSAGNKPSVSRTGTLVHVLGRTFEDMELVWVGRDGTLQASIGEPFEGNIYAPRLSRDGRFVTVTNVVEGASVWLVDTGDGTRRRLARALDEMVAAVGWMPDGETLVMVQGPPDDLRWELMPVDGSGERTSLGSGSWIQDVAPGGERMLVRQHQDASQLWVVALDGGSEPVPFAPGFDRISFAQISPDGRFAAFSASEKGREEIFVTRFPSGEGRWLVHESEGNVPRWSPRGDELFFLQGDEIMVAAIDTSSGVTIGPAQLLFDVSELGPTLALDFDVARDGQRFLMCRSPEGRDPTRLVVVENWTTELAAR